MKATNIANIAAAMRGAKPILQRDGLGMTYTVEPGRVINRNGEPFVAIARVGDTYPTEADALVHRVADMLRGEQPRRLAEDKVKLLRTALEGVTRELRHWHQWQTATNAKYSQSNGWQTVQDLLSLGEGALEATGGKQ